MPETEYEQPIMILSDGGPIRVIPTSHIVALAKIRHWLGALEQSITAENADHHKDLQAMGLAAIDLIEVDQATGISLEVFGAVGDLVSRVMGYAYGLGPTHVSVHWQVA